MEAIPPVEDTHRHIMLKIMIKEAEKMLAIPNAMQSIMARTPVL
jgi:hypothetical protein